MNTVLQWLADNWVMVVAGMYVADKVTKITPTKYDDFVVDVLKDVLKKLIPSKKL